MKIIKKLSYSLMAFIFFLLVSCASGGNKTTEEKVSEDATPTEVVSEMAADSTSADPTDSTSVDAMDSTSAE